MNKSEKLVELLKVHCDYLVSDITIIDGKMSNMINLAALVLTIFISVGVATRGRLELILMGLVSYGIALGFYLCATLAVEYKIGVSVESYEKYKEMTTSKEEATPDETVDFYDWLASSYLDAIDHNRKVLSHKSKYLKCVYLASAISVVIVLLSILSVQ